MYQLSDEEGQELDLIEEHENLEEGNENVETNNDDNVNQNAPDKDDKATKPKRVVRNPRPNLNAERLKGPKGLDALENHFNRVKFKGKGNEENDLNILLKTYEYWCHRLYPKYPFQTCIDQIERLGTKGPIVTYIKKVRSGLIDEEQNDNEIEVERVENEENETVQDIFNDIPIELTEEQIETIKKNQEKAKLLRLEKLKKIQEKAALNTPESGTLGTSTQEEAGLGIENHEEPSLNEIQSEEINQEDEMNVNL